MVRLPTRAAGCYLCGPVIEHIFIFNKQKEKAEGPLAFGSYEGNAVVFRRFDAFRNDKEIGTNLSLDASISRAKTVVNDFFSLG
jgi:hypothetical protein